MEAKFQEKHKLVLNDNKRLRQEVEGLKQQALQQQLQSYAAGRASAVEQNPRVKELQQKVERLKERARQQREHSVVCQAALEEQLVMMKAVKKENRRMRRELARLTTVGGARQQHDTATGADAGQDRMAGAPKQHSKRLRHDETMGREGERPKKRHHALQQQEPAAATQDPVDKQSARTHELDRVAKRFREEARGLQLERPLVGQVAGQRQLGRSEALDKGKQRQGKMSTRQNNGAEAGRLQNVAHGQAAAAGQCRMTEVPMQSLHGEQSPVRRPPGIANVESLSLVTSMADLSVLPSDSPAHRNLLNSEALPLGVLAGACCHGAGAATVGTRQWCAAGKDEG